MIMRNNIGGAPHGGHMREDPRRFTGPNFINTFSSRMPTETELKQAQKSLSLLKAQIKTQTTDAFGYGNATHNTPVPHYGAGGARGPQDRRQAQGYRTDNTALGSIGRKEKMIMDQLNDLDEEQKRKDDMMRKNGYQSRNAGANMGGHPPKDEYYRGRNAQPDHHNDVGRGRRDNYMNNDEPQDIGRGRRGVNRHEPTLAENEGMGHGNRQHQADGGRRNQSPITNNYERMNQVEGGRGNNYRNKFTMDDESPMGGHRFEDDRNAPNPKGRGNRGRDAFGGLDDDRPVGGGKKVANPDDIPITGKGNRGYMDEPPRGGRGYQEESPLGGRNPYGGKGINHEEAPIGGNRRKGDDYRMEEEKPLGRGGRNAYENEYDTKNQMSEMANKNSRRQQQQVPGRREAPNHSSGDPAGEERPLKDVDVNQVIREAAKNDKFEELHECTEGCGRKFKIETLEKHAKICKKVFQTKRKQFDETAMRLNDVVDPSEIKHIKKKVQMVEKQPPKKSAAAKKVDWKAQSEAFRAQIKKAQGKTVTKEEEAAITDAASAGLMPCPSCGRKFGEKAAEKHIPNCQARSKANLMKSKPGPPPARGGGIGKGPTGKRY